MVEGGNPSECHNRHTTCIAKVKLRELATADIRIRICDVINYQQMTFSMQFDLYFFHEKNINMQARFTFFMQKTLLSCGPEQTLNRI